MSVVYAGTLSLCAMRFRWLPVLVSASGLVAVLVPLLVLYGLKAGIVTGMVETLKRDPTVLRIRLVGAISLDDAAIETLRERPEVGFALGAPSSLGRRMEMRGAGSALGIEDSNWLPSMPGDPLLPAGMALSEDEIALAEPLAERLSVQVGDSVEAFTYRNNGTETLRLTLRVVHILPRPVLEPGQNDLGLVDAKVMDIRDAFQTNYEVPALGISGEPLSKRVRAYASVRLYASALDRVIALDRAMTELGFRVDSSATSIAWIEGLDRAMSGIFGIISTAGLIGFSLSLWANVTANLEQQRGQLSLLRLLGMGDRALAAFPMVQAFAIVTLGLTASAAIAHVVAAGINRLELVDMFDHSVCRISWPDLGLAAVGSYAIASVVVMWQLRVLRSIAPSEALAENV